MKKLPLKRANGALVSVDTRVPPRDKRVIQLLEGGGEHIKIILRDPSMQKSDYLWIMDNLFFVVAILVWWAVADAESADADWRWLTLINAHWFWLMPLLIGLDMTGWDGMEISVCTDSMNTAVL